tara:strand:+ start:337 stop:663 length:327 start_codon:yes stop_codon:yes gene_type:complete
MKVTKDYLKKLIKEEIAAVSCEELKARYDQAEAEGYSNPQGYYGGDQKAFNQALAQKCQWAVDLNAAASDKAAQKKTPAPDDSTDKADMSVEERLDSIEQKIDQLLAK